MKSIKDDSAQSPIEVGLLVMVTIITMAFLTTVAGTFTDKFLAVMEEIRAANPLNTAWGVSMWNLLPIEYASWIWAVPGFFCMVIMVWGIKTVVKKSGYTRQEQQYMADENY